MKKIERRDENKNKDFLKSGFYKFCSSKFLLVFLLITIINAIVLVLQFKTITNVLLVVGISLITYLYYFLFKNEMSETKQKLAYLLFRLNLPISILLIINHFLIDYMNSEIIPKIDGNTKIITVIMLVISIAVIFGYLLLSTQGPVNEKIGAVKNIDIREYIENAQKGEEKPEPEDAILGFKVDLEKNVVTNKPVILHSKDRFLHTLILGPTGCGKTSQSIIPMIWRDIHNNQPINGKPLGITVLEPKGDLAEKVYAMVNYKNQLIDEAIEMGTYNPKELGTKRKVLYFNPILNECPYFNPLIGDEDDVIENMCTTFNMLNADSPQFFKDMTDGLVRRSVKLLKRLLGDEATLLDLNTLVWNVGDEGRKNYVMPLRKLKYMPDGSEIRPDIRRENDELIDWFLNDYYAGIGGAKGAPKTYENTSGVRTQISKLVSNKYLKKVLNPPRKGEVGYEESLNIEHINFDEALAEGHIITMSTCQGKLRDLGRFLGYFIILQLQASVFRRPGNENTRTHNMLYIDEFQVYSNPGFSDMLTQGRSYRVASHLATQARAQIGMGSGKDGKSFIELVSTNARNKIIYPGISYSDAKFYADEFGQEEVVKEERSYNQKYMFNTPDSTKVTIRSTAKDEQRFTPTDIMDRPFGQITYRIVSHNSVQPPGVSQISYIPADINAILDKMIEEDNARRAISKDDLEESKTVSNEELTTEARVIPDPMADFNLENFDFNLDKLEQQEFDMSQPIDTQPEKKKIDLFNDAYFDNGSMIPDKPTAKTPPKNIATKSVVEYVDLDDL